VTTVIGGMRFCVTLEVGILGRDSESAFAMNGI
jgi:hypothetical protein